MQSDDESDQRQEEMNRAREQRLRDERVRARAKERAKYVVDRMTWSS